MARARKLKDRLGEHALPLALAAIVLWLVAALVVRSLPGIFEGRGRVLLMCLAMLPAAEAILTAIGIILGVERPKRLPAAALLTMIGITVHALALIGWPSLYGSDETVVRHGAAWIAFAFACPLAIAWLAYENA